jgi:hypothetical protein
MPVNTDDGLHVAGDGPRLVRACCRLGVWFLACMPAGVARIKRDIGYVDNHSAHPHRMAEHG